MAQDPEQQQAEYDPEFLAAFEAKYGPAAATQEPSDPEFEAAFWDKYGPTAKDYAEETLRSLDRAITSGLGQTLEAAPNLVDTAARAFLPEGRVQDVIRGATRLSPLSIAGRALNRASEDYAPQLPDYKQDLGPEGPSKTARFLTGPLSEGVGSTLTFLAGGGIARGAGAGVRGMTATMATLGAAQNAEDARAEAQRMGATPLQELGAAGVSGALGTLEAAEPAMLLSRLERVVGKDIIRKALVELATETTTEAATEAVQQLGQDLYARGTFDPERDLGGWQEAGFQGGAVGAFMSALVSGAHIAQHKIERSREMSQAGRAIANRVVPPGTTVGAAPAPSTFAPGLQNAPGPDPLAPFGAPQATASAPPLAASGAGAEPSERAQALARRTLAANRSLGFLTPEQEQGAQVGGPGDDAEQVALDAATRAMGFDPAWMDAGTRLRGMGAASDGSTIVFDRNASSGERLFGLVTHEWTHAIRSLDGRPRENWNRYRDRLRATLPDLYDASEATARKARKARGIELDADKAENEAVATATESLGGFLRFAYSDPNAAVRLATDNPGFFVKGLRALVRSVQRVGIPISTPHLSRLAQLDAELERHVGALGPGEKNVQGIDKQKALQVVLAAKELFDWMQANPARAMAQTGAAEVAPGAAVPPAKVVPAAPAATAPAEYVEPPAAVQPQPASSTMGYPEAQISPTEAQPQPIPEPTPSATASAPEQPAPAPPSTPEAPPPSGEEEAGLTLEQFAEELQKEPWDEPRFRAMARESQLHQQLFDTFLAARRESAAARSRLEDDNAPDLRGSLPGTDEGARTLDVGSTPEGEPSREDAGGRAAGVQGAGEGRADVDLEEGSATEQPSGESGEGGERRERGEGGRDGGTGGAVLEGGQAPASPSDLSALFDEVLDDAFSEPKPEKEKPKRRGARKPNSPKSETQGSETPPKKSTLDQLGDDLETLFAVEPDGIDEDKYAKVKPTLEGLAKELGKDAKDPRAILVAIVSWLRDTRKWDAARIATFKPYALRFARETLAQPNPPKASKKKREAPASGPRNYVITPEDAIGQGGAKEKARANIEAIRIVKKLREEKRLATDDEKRKLVKYVGWGASELAQGLFPPYGMPKPEWRELHDELKGLLTAEEWSSAARSTINAHYTSEEVVRAIYTGVERLGFRGGRVLEPGLGIGHFIGLMPDDLARSVSYSGVELDPTSAAIAQALYPNADIRAQGFEEFQAPKNFYDLAIGNPPFADVKILKDPEYRDQKLSLHDFFFVKALDRVKPGGLLVFITSRYTMDKQSDKVRSKLQEQADLLGAIRLPQTAFKQNAGTEVVTDIIFLRKRNEGEAPAGKEWSQLAEVSAGSNGETAMVNEFFAKNPIFVLGEHSLAGTMYGKHEYTLLPGARAQVVSIGEQVREAVKLLPRNVYKTKTRSDGATEETAPAVSSVPPDVLKDGAYYIEGGKLFQSLSKRGVEVRQRGKGEGGMSKPDMERVRSFVPVRDALRALIHAQTIGEDDAKVRTFQVELEKHYNAFVKKHGNLTAFTTSEREDKETGETIETRRAVNASAWEEDPDAALVESLESYDEAKETFVKAKIFTERTIRPAPSPKIESASDALNVVLAQKGRVDIEAIARLRSQTVDQAVAELGARVYLDPEGEKWVTDDEYLSGNVRAKLAAAKGARQADARYNRNVEALEAVQPKDLEPSKISVRLGASWIPAEDVQRFARSLGIEDARVEHDQLGNLWTVGDSRYERSAAATQTWGTDRMHAVELLRRGLNAQQVVVYDRDADGRPVTNATATAAAVAKLQAIQEELEKWLWKDQDRAIRLARKYNDDFNNTVARKFNGEHLTLPGMSSAVTLRPHQKAGVWRILQSGNTYLAHGVGAGKTFLMVSAAMEMRRLGIAQKPLFVVPNHMLKQFAREALTAYPNAQIMVADEQQFAKGVRKRFVARVATGNWDLVILTFSAFKKVPLSDETVADFAAKQLAEMEKAYGLNASDVTDRRTRKQIEKKMESLRQKIAARTDQSGKDSGPTFEQLGVDFMFIDEAHEYRKVDFATNQTRVKGIDPNGSAAAIDAYMKVRYLDRLKPGRNLVLASGTPITNTMGELFSLQRFMQLQDLERLGLHTFDAWAAAFGDLVATPERTPTGTYQVVSRFARFRNLPELGQLVRQRMDVVRVKDLDYIKRPKVRGGSRQIVVTPQPKRMPELLVALGHTLDHAAKRDRGMVMLRVIGDGRFASIDLRFQMHALGNAWNPSRESDPDGKLNQLISAAFKKYQETTGVQMKDENGQPFFANLTQMIFADLGAPDSAESRGFSAYTWIKSELIRMGVPANEIAFMQDYKNSDAKRSLFREMNAGKKRILIGSSRSMGTGVNAQRLLVALHHLDAPWFPSDIEQREGRIWRQGNLNEEIEINAFATKGSYDETMWQTNERKARFIEQFFLGDPSMRSMDDLGSEADSFATAKAMTSGDPRVIEKVNLETELDRLSLLRNAHEDEKHARAREIQFAKEHVRLTALRIEPLERTIADRGPIPEKASEVVLEHDGKAYSGKELDKYLTDAAQAVAAQDEKKLKSYDGIKADVGFVLGQRLEVQARQYVTAETSYYWHLYGASNARVQVTAASAVGVHNALARWEAALKDERASLQKSQSRIAEFEQIKDAPFQYEQQYQEKSRRLDELDRELFAENQQNAQPQAPPDSGTVTYATEPDDADIKRVKALTKKALKKGEATKIGRKPRPIANTSDNPYVRASQRAARERRFEKGMATPIPHDAQRQRAIDELESDYQGTKERLLEKIDRGDALNAWEQHAASILKNDAAMAVLTAKKGPEAKRLYRESVLLHWAYQSGARAEAARALGTIRDALTPVERLAEILSTPGEKTRKALEEGDEKMLEKALEEESPDIERMKRWLIEAGFDPENITADYLNDPISLGRIARIVSTARGTLWDWVQEWMITSMLGGPATNMANLTGNAAMQVYDQHMKRLASTLANFAVRDNTAFSVGETSAFYKAWLRGAMAGARNFVLSWRTELPVFDVELAAEGARLGKYAPKLDSQYGPKIPGVVGRLARAPSTRLLLAVDEFFKTLTATTEAAALAFRAAKNEGHKGEALDARIDELLSNKKHEIWTQAFQEAKRVTFQDENGVLTRAALQVRGWANSPWSEVGTWMANKRAFGWRVGSPPVGTALLPFIRTPVAIFRMGLSVPLHPLKALYTIPLAVAKGDRRTVLQDGTAALISLGITLAILHAVWSPGDDDDDLPFITGSGGDKRTRDLRNRTVPDYSIRVGGDWYSYRRVEPAAVTIATLVDLANEFSRYMKGGEDAQAVDALGRLIASVADQAADKTFLRTFGDLYSAIIERESKSIGPRLVRDQVLRMVPNIVRQPIGRTDEYLRQQTVRSYEDKGVWTAAAASLPYYSWPTAANAPPPRYSLWGQPVSKGDSNSIYFWRLMSPWPKSQEAERIHPLDRLILNWNAKVEDGKAGQDAKLFNPKPPDYWYTIGGKTLYWNDDEWEILQRDAGQAAAERLATRRLNYDDPNDKDIEIIQDALSRARARVRKDLLSRRNNEQEESP